MSQLMAPAKVLGSVLGVTLALMGQASAQISEADFQQRPHR